MSSARSCTCEGSRRSHRCCEHSAPWCRLSDAVVGRLPDAVGPMIGTLILYFTTRGFIILRDLVPSFRFSVPYGHKDRSQSGIGHLAGAAN